MKINNHYISSELHYPLDYTSLNVDISIEEKFIQETHWTIIKNSKEKANFISDFIKVIENIDMTYIPDKESFESIIQEYARFLEFI